MKQRSKTEAILIHHTVTDPNISMAKLRAIFKSRFNVNYVGYNVVVFADGHAESDIGDGGYGIHNNIGKYQNYNSVSISLAGNFEESEIPKAQLDGLKRELDRLRAKYGINEDKVFGHRDMKATACPGKNLYNWLAKYKEGEDMGRIEELEAEVRGWRDKYNTRVPELKRERDKLSKELKNIKAKKPQFKLGVMMDFLSKLNSRKLWVLVLWVVSALVDMSFAKDLMPVVSAYVIGQGIADASVNLKK